MSQQRNKGQFFRRFRDCVQGFDLYGEPVRLLLRKQEKYSTPLGVFISILILAAVGVLSISLIYQMISHQNPVIVSKIESNLYPEAYSLNPENFFFAIGMGDAEGVPIINYPDAIAYVPSLSFCHQENSFDQSTGRPTNTNECSTIQMIPCSDANINPDLIKGQSKDRLSFAMCLNTTSWTSIIEKTYLNGLGSSQTFGYMVLNVKKCNRTQQSSKMLQYYTDCANDDILMERMRYGFFQLLFTDTLLDQGQSGNPYNKVLKTVTSSFTSTTQSYIKYTYRHNYFKTVDNFYYLFPQEDNYHALTLSNEFESTMAVTDNLAQVFLFLDDKSERYTRTYTTILDVFGQIGGFQTFLIFLGSLIMTPLTKLCQSVTLLNQIFTFDDQTQLSIGSHEVTRNNQIVPQTLDPSCQQIKKLLNQKHKQLDIHGLQYIALLCCGRKKQLLSEGIDKLYAQLDISSIITKLLELEKLKHFLLNENQIKLFEYIPKPTIQSRTEKHNYKLSLQKQRSTVQFFTNRQEDDRKLSLALEAYRFLKDSQQPDDLKLIDMMDDEVREYFNLNQQEISLTNRQTIPFTNALTCFNNQPENLDMDKIEEYLNEEVLSPQNKVPDS